MKEKERYRDNRESSNAVFDGVASKQPVRATAAI
jgi:hypothetical protein